MKDCSLIVLMIIVCILTALLVSMPLWCDCDGKSMYQRHKEERRDRP